MALPASGPLSLNDIQVEFGGDNPIGINEYYGVAAGIPASDTISINDFYGASAIPPPVTDSLILFLDAGDPASYPGSGTVWTDLTGNNYGGTLSGGPVYSTNNGGAILLDGSNDYVYLANSSNINFVSNFSINYVFKYRISDSTAPFVEKYYYGSTGRGGWGLRGSNGNYVFFILNRTSSAFISLPSFFTVNQIYDLTVTVTGGPTNPTVRLYSNGVLQGTQTLSQTIATNTGRDVLIGRYGDLASAYTKQDAYSLKMYTKVLSAAEVLQNFNSTKDRYGL